MFPQTNLGSQAYLKTKVLTASPAELRLMLFDGAIRFTEQARRGYEARDYEAAYDGTSKTQAILMELINSLRTDQSPELCQRLTALYTYMYTNLMTASSTREVALVDEVIKMLRYERETWSMCIDELARENRDASAMRTLPSAPIAPQTGTAATPRISFRG